MADDFDITWEMRLFSGALRKARIARGVTMAEVAAVVGCSTGMVGAVESLRSRPSDGLRARLAEWVGCRPEDIWPDWLESGRVRDRVVGTQAVNEQTFSSLPAPERKGLLGMASARAEVSPDEQDDARMVIKQCLKTLTRREQEVIKLRYGLKDGTVHTYEEIGRICQITRERVRQIEARAILKMHHPVRSSVLEKAARALGMSPCPAPGCGKLTASWRLCDVCGKAVCPECWNRAWRGSGACNACRLKAGRAKDGVEPPTPPG